MATLGYAGILIFVFLLAILLGLQIQITTLFRKVDEMRKDEKK